MTIITNNQTKNHGLEEKEKNNGTEQKFEKRWWGVSMADGRHTSGEKKQNKSNHSDTDENQRDRHRRNLTTS